ncbi:MAG: NAD(P)-dependent alcohol dehydrogenase [Chloroflexi bacterium]|nr:NAD(P)-dependent alcohol dehydrogenase [Chloroflexota bacterium]
MKAIISTQYGSPDVLQFAEIAQPMPQADEVLIKVHAATVTPSDCAFRKADPFIIRLMYGLTKPRLAVPGVEFAGEIVAVGSAVTTFKAGDRVCGISPDRFGAQAEYLTLPVTKPLTLMSPRQSYAEAVGIVDGAATALLFLRDVAKVQRGQRVLINGASGAVGAYAVQIAKYYGAHVTGVCSAANVELVRSLGADAVIDYTREDFAKSGQAYDVIFDAVGKRTYGQCQRALTPQGIYMTTVPTLGTAVALLRTARSRGKRAGFTTAGLKQNRANLDFLTGLFDQGALRAVIDRCYPLAQVAEAHRYVETGRKKGNVIITVAA